MSTKEIQFRGGVRTVLGWGAAFTVVLAMWVSIDSAVSDRSAWIGLMSEIGKFALLAGATVVVLRLEEVRLEELGLSRRHVLPALIIFGGGWIALNLFGVGIAIGTGLQWGVNLIWATVNPRWESLPAPWLTTVLLQFLVVGMVEEFTVRGYFQTKMIALFGDKTRPRIALGIVTAAVFFGLLHIPGAVIDGASLTGVLTIVALRTVTGLFFGLFYELTHNVYFVALLHGLGNTWPLMIDWSTWSGLSLVVFFVGVGVIYLGMTLAYRYWMVDTDQTPVVARTDVVN